jgi:hypothetical protein
MKQAFKAYLKSIGITSAPYLKRVEELHDFVIETGIMNDITDILVEDYIKEDGTREYTDLNFWSNGFSFSALGFLTKDSFVIDPEPERFNRLEIDKEHYDFKTATEQSRLSVTIAINDTQLAIFVASKENCHQLRDILFKLLLPNLKS